MTTSAKGRSPGAWTRLTWLIAGFAWAGSTILQLARAQYWDPTSALDYAAVVIYSAAWSLLGPSVILLARDTTRAAMGIAAVAATGSILTGVANLVEDGIGVSSAGSFYVIGFFTGWLPLLPLAVAIGRANQSRLGAVAVLVFLGILLVTSVGGFLILVALTALAIRPAWFLRRDLEANASDVLFAHEAPR